MWFFVPDLKEAVDNRIHDRVEAGEEEKGLLDALVDPQERVLVDHEPHDDGVVRGPAEDEHQHDHHRHFQRLGLGTVQNPLRGTT